MAIYAVELTAYSRSRGESMPMKSAYRSGTKIHDRRLGRTADYTRRRGVELAFMAFPHELMIDREEIWNAVEAREVRRDACVGRQLMIALPAELSPAGRERCARRIAAYLVEQFGVFVDCAIHEPNPAGDKRNWHLHLLFPTRSIDASGHLTTKTRRLDDLTEGPKVVLDVRKICADVINQELALEGHGHVRVDHRSNAAREIADKPGVKLGVAAIGIERRTGKPSAKRLHISKPIEINMMFVDAVRAYEAELEAASSKQQHNERGPTPVDVDIGALLASLRVKAKRQTARDVDAKVLARNAARTPASPPSRKRQRKAPAVAAARGTERIGRNAGESVGACLLTRQVNRPSGLPVVQPATTERLGVDDRTKIWAFAIAAAGLTMTNSAAEVASFIERSCEFVAGQLGLPAVTIKARAERYRSLGRTQIEGVLASVFEQFRRLIDTLQDRHDEAKRGKKPSRRPFDTMGHAQAAVAHAILGAVEVVDRLLADKHRSRTTPSIDATLEKEGVHKTNGANPAPAATRDRSKTREDADVHGTAAKAQAPALRDVPPVRVAAFESRHRQGSDETIAFNFEPPHQSTTPRKQTPDKARDSVKVTAAPQPELTKKSDLAVPAGNPPEEQPSLTLARKSPLDARLPTTASADGASQRSEKTPPDDKGPQSTQGGTATVTGSTTVAVEAPESTKKPGAERAGKKTPKTPTTRRGKDDWGR